MRVRAILFVAVALVGFGAFAAGCGDDGEDPLTLEEYFERVGELDDEQQARSEALDQELDDLGEDVTPNDLADSFDEQVEALQDFADDLDDIEPPAEVEEAHDQAVAAMRAARDQFDAIVGEFRDADSVEEAFASVDDSDFSEIEKANDACRELEQVAADNNIEADYDCGDAE